MTFFAAFRRRAAVRRERAHFRSIRRALPGTATTTRRSTR